MAPIEIGKPHRDSTVASRKVEQTTYHADAETAFAKSSGLNKYRAIAIITWIMVILTQSILGFCRLFGSSPTWRTQTFWVINEAHQTMFALNRESVFVYWYTLNFLQTIYIYVLYFGNEDNVSKAMVANAHFIAYNVLHVLWMAFWVCSQFWLGEVCLAINFLHLWSLYLNHKFAGISHLSVVAGPLVWTFLSLFTNGAALLDGHSRLPEAVGYVFILAIFFFWIGVVLCYNDHALGFCFSFLFFSLGIQQSVLGIHEFSIISASVIGAMFFITSLVLAILAALGKELSIRYSDDDTVEDEEAERNLESPESAEIL